MGHWRQSTVLCWTLPGMRLLSQCHGLGCLHHCKNRSGGECRTAQVEQRHTLFLLGETGGLRCTRLRADITHLEMWVSWSRVRRGGRRRRGWEVGREGGGVGGRKEGRERELFLPWGACVGFFDGSDLWHLFMTRRGWVLMLLWSWVGSSRLPKVLLRIFSQFSAWLAWTWRTLLCV